MNAFGSQNFKINYQRLIRIFWVTVECYEEGEEDGEAMKGTKNTRLILF